MVALKTGRPGVYDSRDDLSAALAKITDDAPIIHMAHEPDLFIDVPERVSLTLSGHTHGGQVRLFGYSPMVPSSYGNRFAYGHIVEGWPSPDRVGWPWLLHHAGAIWHAAGNHPARAGLNRRLVKFDRLVPDNGNRLCGIQVLRCAYAREGCAHADA
jgi:hypothetical protein